MRCSGCKTPNAWYCSVRCQRELWPIHIFECNPGKPINTAYHLARAARRDYIPNDPQTCKDYGFEKAFTASNRSNLLGLYQGLINVNRVKPKTIHRWRLNGTLVQEIKAVYEELPVRTRGRYYPWFLQNQWVLDPAHSKPTDLVHDMMLRGWQYAGGSSSATSEEIKAGVAKWPEEKQMCFSFCMNLLSDWHPHPAQAAWLLFGFCVCQDEYGEASLSRIYRQLLTKCSFDEIFTAYKSSTLIALFDAKGLKSQRQSIQYLEDVLSGLPNGNISVWDLKQYIVAEDAEDVELIRSVSVDYGFINCKNEEENQELKEVYKQFFSQYRADPVELHEACIAGRLFEYVGGFVELNKKNKNKKKFSRLMKNPYPLPDI
jgi:hypothetical protein